MFDTDTYDYIQLLIYLNLYRCQRVSVVLTNNIHICIYYNEISYLQKIGRGLPYLQLRADEKTGYGRQAISIEHKRGSENFGNKFSQFIRVLLL